MPMFALVGVYSIRQRTFIFSGPQRKTFEAMRSMYLWVNVLMEFPLKDVTTISLARRGIET